jgi:hypothetical protein
VHEVSSATAVLFLENGTFSSQRVICKSVISTCSWVLIHA